MRTFSKMKHTMVLIPSIAYVVSLNLFKKKYFLMILIMGDFLFVQDMTFPESFF